MRSFDILTEPVRGHVPPPWFAALSGLDRMRAWSNGLLPPSPTARLTGSRCTHVGPGSAICVMPTSEMQVAPNGHLLIMQVVADALWCALTTSAAPGQVVRVLSMSTFHFRPARAGAGNFLARARVVNSSTWFAYAEVSVEDSEGRQIGHCGGQAAFVTLDPAPPVPPSSLALAEQPVWPTPDPWQRPPGPNSGLSMLDTVGGLEIARAISSGSLRSPALALIGLQPRLMGDGHVSATFPASGWHCTDSPLVSLGVIATVLNCGGGFSLLTMHRAGDLFAGLDEHFRLFRQVPADGRPMRLEARSVRGEGDQYIQASAIYDADNNLVASANAMAVMIDDKRRKRHRRRAAERALCTILFTDIVNSTGQAGALGDKAWNALLGQHNETARREIARCTGTVVKTTGDGLLARFTSPAQGLDCAVRLRDALGGLGISVRAGLHVGECEITDDDIVGTAVNLAARIQAAAQPGEIYVSSTVRDLVSGSATRFESRGEHQLKGFDEPWRLWSVT